MRPWLNKGPLWSVWGNSWYHEAFSYNNIWYPCEYHMGYNFEQCLVLPWVPFKHFTWGTIQMTTPFKIMCNVKCLGELLGLIWWLGIPRGSMGEESPYNSILNSKRISSPRDPRSPNQPLVVLNIHSCLQVGDTQHWCKFPRPQHLNHGFNFQIPYMHVLHES
jgi:hypothetical protein